MAKLQIALCFLLVFACVVQGEGIFETIIGLAQFVSGEISDLLLVIDNKVINDTTCTPSDILELSSSSPFDSSVECLAKLRTALESENATGITELLETLDSLSAILSEGASCATENSWIYVVCYLNTIAKAMYYLLSAAVTEIVADWEVVLLNDDLRTMVESCEATILDTAVIANIVTAVDEAAQCVENLS